MKGLNSILPLVIFFTVQMGLASDSIGSQEKFSQAKKPKPAFTNSLNAEFYASTFSELEQALSLATNGSVISLNGVIEGSFTVPSGVTLKGGEITGFTDISGGWLKISGNIYRRAVNAVDIKYMLINGQNTLKGRWPNEQWAIIDGNNSTTYLLDSDLNQFSEDFFTGGEVVFKVRRYRFNIRIITEMKGDRITFPTSSYGADRGYGYFIQNHVNCLDREGEWAFDGTYVYLFHPNPNALNIKVSTLKNGLTLGSGAVLENVSLSGFNDVAVIPARNGRDQRIRNCFIQYAVQGISGTNCDNIQISENYLRDIGDRGIDINNATGIIISNNKLKAIGVLPGYNSTGLWGICATFVPSAVISYNELDSIGYNGIIVGNNSGTQVIGNAIRNYCMLADDGGGIYLGGFIDGLVANNFVQGGSGNLCIPSNIYKDYSNKGIYLDGINGNRNVEIRENMCIGSSFNIFLNPSNDITIKDNLLMMYFSGEELTGLLWSDAGSNHKVTGNQFIAAYIDAKREAWAHRIRNAPTGSFYGENYYFLPFGQIGGTKDVILRYLVPLSAREWMDAGYGSNEHDDKIVWNESLQVTRDEFIDSDYNFSKQARSYFFKPGFSYMNPRTGQNITSLILKPYEGAILYKVRNSGTVATDVSEKTSTAVKVYPNPVSEFLFIDIQDNPKMIFEFYSDNGILLRMGELTEKVSLINVREYPSGVYIIKTQAEGFSHAEKIILQ